MPMFKARLNQQQVIDATGIVGPANKVEAFGKPLHGPKRPYNGVP